MGICKTGRGAQAPGMARIRTFLAVVLAKNIRGGFVGEVGQEERDDRRNSDIAAESAQSFFHLLLKYLRNTKKKKRTLIKQGVAEGDWRKTVAKSMKSRDHFRRCADPIGDWTPKKKEDTNARLTPQVSKGTVPKGQQLEEWGRGLGKLADCRIKNVGLSQKDLEEKNRGLK